MTTSSISQLMNTLVKRYNLTSKEQEAAPEPQPELFKKHIETGSTFKELKQLQAKFEKMKEENQGLKSTVEKQKNEIEKKDK